MSERRREGEMSPLQKAAEAYWDVFRNPDTRVDENWAAQDVFLEALNGDTDLMNRLIEKMVEMDGYYGGLRLQLELMVEAGLSNVIGQSRIQFARDLEDISNIIEGWK